LAEGKRLISTPISARIAAAAICLHPRNTQQQLHRLLKRAEPLLDLPLQLLDTVFQVANVRKDLAKQHLVLRLDLPAQRLLELGQFVAQRATSQISQLL